MTRGRVCLLAVMVVLGARVAVVEESRLGGTCVNVGCIPTKTLVGSARAIHMARRGGEVEPEDSGLDADADDAPAGAPGPRAKVNDWGG